VPSPFQKAFAKLLLKIVLKDKAENC